LRGLGGETARRLASASLGAAPLQISPALACRGRLSGLVARRARRIHQALAIDEHLDRPLETAVERIKRIAQRLLPALEHLAHALLALEDRAHAQGHDRALGQRGVEHRLVAAGNALEPAE